MTTEFEHFFNRLKLISKSKTDADLARKLGISRSSIANWKSRERVDYSLIFKTFDHSDFNYLIKGDSYALNDLYDQKSLAEEAKEEYKNKKTTSANKGSVLLKHQIINNKELLERIIKINKLSKKEQDHIYYTIDAMIKSAKLKKGK